MHTLRHATFADIPELCALLAQLFGQEVEFVADAATQARGLQRIFEAPDSGDILVLAEDDRPVGMVSLLYLTSTALAAASRCWKTWWCSPASAAAAAAAGCSRPRSSARGSAGAAASRC